MSIWKTPLLGVCGCAKFLERLIVIPTNVRQRRGAGGREFQAAGASTGIQTSAARPRSG